MTFDPLNLSIPPQLPFEDFKWRWAVTTPTEGLIEKDVFLGVLKVLFHHDGERHGTESFRSGMEELEKSVTTRVDLSRKNNDANKNIIENSGQYWKALGLLETQDGVINLTSVGKELATGQITEDQFIEHLVETFELPNKFIEKSNVVDIWNQNGVKVKPIRLIFEILYKLTESISSPASWYITADELQKIVVPLSAYNQVSMDVYVKYILSFRKDPQGFSDWPNATQASNDSRMVKEYLIFLANFDFLDIIESKGQKLYFITDKILKLIGGEQNQFLKIENPAVSNNYSTNFNYMNFYDATVESNYQLSKQMALRFVSSLLTKPFVILTGLAGSGKTKLAVAFSKWICLSEDQVCIVPVGADWSTRDPLLGYPNALKSGDYIKPESGVLDLLLRATVAESSGDSKPYFIILDEMNLSHVERYFADFLSAMESDEEIYLHSMDNEFIVPKRISIPNNIFIIGTVNIDETTYMFSPKVLDRANVLEFRVEEEEIRSYLSNPNQIDISRMKSLGASAAASFLKLANDKALSQSVNIETKQTLYSIFGELKKVGAEFGYRSAFEIVRFCSIISILEPDISNSAALDFAVMQKLLPKLHGSRRKLEPAIKMLGALCIDLDLSKASEIKVEDILTGKFDLPESAVVKMPCSFEKLSRMYRALMDAGFTSYAEA